MSLPDDYRALAADITARCRPPLHDETLRDLVMEASVLIDKAARAPTGHGGGPLLAALTMLRSHECEVYEFGDRLIPSLGEEPVVALERRYGACLSLAIHHVDQRIRLEAVRDALASLEAILDSAAAVAA